jgi:hypothetical protein
MPFAPWLKYSLFDLPKSSIALELNHVILLILSLIAKLFVGSSAAVAPNRVEFSMSG